MISSIRVEGFKRFSDQSFTLFPLTVLTGLNGSGKTSLIHSFLMFREACAVRGAGVVQLNGPYGLELGTAEDISNWNAASIAMTIVEDEGVHRLTFSSSSDDAMFLTAIAPEGDLPVAFSPQPGSFTYLAAERLGPRSSIQASSLPIDSLEVGVQGEHCAQILESLGSKPVNLDRLHPASTAPFFLKYEVERWLSEIARPVEIEAERYPGSTVCALKFRSPEGAWVRATNMGFGVSYALPVILAGLTARKGGLLLIENPEAHLHPAGQSRIGFFLAWLASKGVQVILETHSDHVLNGIRRAIAGQLEQMTSTDAVVHFFGSGDLATVNELHFTPTGGISHWPVGFFDQYQIDVAALGQVRRQGVGHGVRS